MTRRIVLSLLGGMLLALFASGDSAEAQQRAYGRNWGSQYNMHDYERFYHYPYVYYPQNFWGNDYYRSSESLYYRYPQEMRIPVYNRQWHNYYPQDRRWHHGNHFALDVF
jgi:hypothetical protein